MLMEILDSSWDQVPFVDKLTSFTWAPQPKLEASVNMESLGGVDVISDSKISKLLLTRVLEGEFPDPEGPGVVSFGEQEKLKRSKVKPPVWDLICR
jgi:hypothetical protein